MMRYGPSKNCAAYVLSHSTGCKLLLKLSGKNLLKETNHNGLTHLLYILYKQVDGYRKSNNGMFMIHVRLSNEINRAISDCLA